MRSASRYQALACALLLSLTVVPAAESQSLKDRLKSKAQARANGKADQVADKLLDRIENAIKCVAGDDECVANAEAGGKEVVLTDDAGKILPPDQQPENSPARTAAPAAVPATSAAKAAGAPGTGAWANFDFVPGERVLFSDDFSRDRVGNFPQRLELVKGNLQIVESNGMRWLESTSLDGEIAVPLPENLPPRFTVEFDFTFPGNFPITVYSGARPVEEEFGDGAATSYLAFGAFEAGIHVGGRALSNVEPKVNGAQGGSLPGTVAHARIHVDGKYVKTYINETRIVNVPNGDIGRGNKLFIRLPYIEEHPVMIGNISVNAGGMDMYDALLADGRVVTQGIYFDVGSDRIRPESTPTLKLIGDMLTEHPELKLTVEGHTDNTGNAASNQTLSEKRAQAIVAYLTSTGGVAPARLIAQGLGASKPAKSNDTSEGRQQNRRVELVKM